MSLEDLMSKTCVGQVHLSDARVVWMLLLGTVYGPQGQVLTSYSIFHINNPYFNKRNLCSLVIKSNVCSHRDENQKNYLVLHSPHFYKWKILVRILRNNFIFPGLILEAGICSGAHIVPFVTSESSLLSFASLFEVYDFHLFSFPYLVTAYEGIFSFFSFSLHLKTIFVHFISMVEGDFILHNSASSPKTNIWFLKLKCEVD